MSDLLWIALPIAAVLGFWILGAHNRLVALRNEVAAAWMQADIAQRRRSQGTERLVAALRAPLASEQGALDALWAAQAQSARAAGVMSARPLVVANALAWTEAESRLGAAAARVFALAESHADAVAGIDDLEGARAAWAEGEQGLRFARQLFNTAADAYNDAIAVFPTSLLRPLFNFAAAGKL